MDIFGDLKIYRKISENKIFKIMEENKFWNHLTQGIELPFEVSDVKIIDENCGTVFIELNNGDVYHLCLLKCEDDNESKN